MVAPCASCDTGLSLQIDVLVVTLLFLHPDTNTHTRICLVDESHHWVCIQASFRLQLAVGLISLRTNAGHPLVADCHAAVLVSGQGTRCPLFAVNSMAIGGGCEGKQLGTLREKALDSRHSVLQPIYDKKWCGNTVVRLLNTNWK